MSRKFRWTLESPNFKESFVKISSRPIVEDLKEIDYLSAKTWIPNKVPPQTINIVVFDKVDLSKVPTLESGQLEEFKLRLYDGCGNCMEIWHLKDTHISNVKESDLDYSTDEKCTEFNLNFKTHVYENIPYDYKKSPNLGMGIGLLYPKEVTCPQCTHKFKV